MSDEPFFLANAYLDGELTDDERRIAEADPDVMAEVETLRALQARLRTVPAPTEAARDSAIAAAMSTFTSVAGAPAEVEAPAVVPLRPRPAYARALGIAAAVVAVVGLGVVASQVGSRSDDDAATEIDAAAAREGEATAEALEATAEETADGGSDAAEPAAGDGELAVAELDTASSGDAAEDERADVAEEMSEESGSVTATGGSDDSPWAQRPDLADRPVTLPDAYEPDGLLVGLEDLAVRGVFLVRERDEGRLPPSPNTACARDDETLARAEALFDDVLVILIAVDEVGRTVAAVDAATCEELAVAPLPRLER